MHARITYSNAYQSANCLGYEAELIIDDESFFLLIEFDPPTGIGELYWSDNRNSTSTIECPIDEDDLDEDELLTGILESIRLNGDFLLLQSDISAAQLSVIKRTLIFAYAILEERETWDPELMAKYDREMEEINDVLNSIYSIYAKIKR
jgi:hypothetical protein